MSLTAVAEVDGGKAGSFGVDFAADEFAVLVEVQGGLADLVGSGAHGVADTVHESGESLSVFALGAVGV